MNAPAFIPNDVLPRLRSLRLASRLHADTHGFGAHRSAQRGAGLEFAQYRAYEQGDDPRQVDWKLYARSDRYYVREAERESPLTAWVLIDASASMAQAGRTHPHTTRLDAARTLAACIAHVAARDGDRFGMASLHASGPRLVPAGRGPRQRDRCLLALHALQADGASCPEMLLRPLWSQLRAQDLVIVLSDGFDEALLGWMEKLSAARRDLAHIQLLSSDERDFRFKDSQWFRDVETGERLQTDAHAVRADFLQRFGEAQTQLAQRMAHAGIRHIPHVLDAPIDAPLQALFGERVR